MVSGLSASTVKGWFQYRCERKTRYDMMTRSERDSATIVKEESGAAWALEGNKFEERVLARVRAEQPLLGPGPNEDRLGQAETIAFLCRHPGLRHHLKFEQHGVQTPCHERSLLTVRQPKAQ
jgi:hypothetical protein